MMRDSRRIISPGNEVAITTYIAGAFGGLLPVVGLAEAKSMTDMLGPSLVTLWGGVAFAAGLLVAAVALLSRFQDPTKTLLIVECVTLTILGVCWGFYEYTLVAGNGFNQVLFTQNWVTWPAIGFLWRAFEITRDVRRARRDPKVGD